MEGEGEGHGESQGETAYGIPIPLTLQQIFDDFVGRRDSLIKALTTEFESFEFCCTDTEGINEQRLWGHPHGDWEVIGTDPGEVFELPPPPACLYSAGNTKFTEKFRATRVAARCDPWLTTVANHFAAKIPLVEADRQRLLKMIGEQQTVSEAVAAFWETRLLRDAKKGAERLEEE